MRYLLFCIIQKHKQRITAANFAKKMIALGGRMNTTLI